jgi:hypothetical protein
MSTATDIWVSVDYDAIVSHSQTVQHVADFMIHGRGNFGI